MFHTSSHFAKGENARFSSRNPNSMDDPNTHDGGSVAIEEQNSSKQIYSGK
jgi:hypothetical protein